MAYKKNKPLKDRVNSQAGRDAAAAAAEVIKKEAARLRAENAGKPGYDDEGNQLTTDKKEKLKVRNKSITEDLEKGIDLEKLREEGTPGIDPLYSTTMSPKMKESYEKNQGNPEFNREMDAYRKAKNKGNLTDEDRIRILNRNKQLLQIVQTGRNALSIGSGLWNTYRALSSLRKEKLNGYPRLRRMVKTAAIKRKK